MRDTTHNQVTAMIERAIRTVQSDVQDVASTVSDAAARAASEAVERLRDKSNSLSAEDVEALVRRLLEVERADQLARKDYAFKVRPYVQPSSRRAKSWCRRWCTTAPARRGTTSRCRPSTWRVYRAWSC